MTEAERKKRGEKSTVIVERLVRAQLRAMGCERFELGIRRDAGEMILREGQDHAEIEKTIKWLRHDNAKGAHIYIRPTGAPMTAVRNVDGRSFSPSLMIASQLRSDGSGACRD